MIKQQQLNYYDWDDVEQFICDELNITSDQFRDYHTVIGGDYKDFWHVWLTIHYEEITNGYLELELDDIDFLMARIVPKYGEWVECLRPVLNKLREEIGDSATIYYHW